MSLEHDNNNKIVWVDINTIKLNPKNTNKHSQEQVESLAKIINYQGFRSPLVVAKKIGNIESNILAAGEGRYLAAKHLGLSKVPVSYQEFIDDDQFRSYVTSDNAIALWADLDFGMINDSMADFAPEFDLDLLGIQDFVLTPEDKFSDKDADLVPEVEENEYGVQLGDIYQLGEHRIMCGDSTSESAVEILMNGQKADIYTDPPYGIKEDASKRITREKNSLAKTNSKLKNFIDDSNEYAIKAYNITRFMKSSFECWWGANYYCHSLPQTNNWIVWDKRVEDKQRDNNSDAELAWCNSKRKSTRIFRHLWKGLIKGSEHGVKRVHPTQKPIQLHCEIFEYFKVSSNILDLFLGSGSTLIACEKTNRKCYGMELDPHYVSVIIKRWEDFTGLKHKKLN